MSEIIEHLEKFRDNLTKLSGRIESESGYSTKLFSFTNQDFKTDQIKSNNFSNTATPNVDFFQNEVKTLVDENNSLRNELKRIINEQIEEELSENMREKTFHKEQIEISKKKKEMAEEICGVAMEHVNHLEEELEYVKNICDVPGVYNQLQKIQFEYRCLFENQNKIMEEMQCELHRVQGENRLGKIQIEDYRSTLENVRAKVKIKCSKMEDLCELRMIYDDKITELNKQMESDALKIQNMDEHILILENEAYKSKEFIAMLQQKIGSLEEAKERLIRENKQQEEFVNNSEITKMKIRHDLSQKEEELNSFKKYVKDVIEESKSNAQEQIKLERAKQEQTMLNTKNDNLRLNQENSELRYKLLMAQEHQENIQTENTKDKNDMTDKIQKLYDSKNNQDKKLNSLISENRNLIQENKKLKEKTADILAKGNEENKRLNKQTETLTNRIKLIQKENEQTQQNSDNLINQKNSLLEELRENLKNKNKQCIYLKSKLNSINEEFEMFKIDSEKQVRFKEIEKESIIEEMNSLLEEQRCISEKCKTEYKQTLSQKDRQIEILSENSKKFEKNTTPLTDTIQKYEKELADRDDIIQRHQIQNLESQKDIAKYRKIMKVLSRRSID